MNTILLTKLTGYGREIADHLILEGLNIRFWLGARLPNVPVPKGCVLYDAWDAFRLTDPPEIPGDPDVSADYSALLDWVDGDSRLTYLRILTRVDFFGSFGMEERHNHFDQQLLYWLKVIRAYQIEVLVEMNSPHCPHDYPLFLCARFLGLKTVFFHVTFLGNWYYLARDLEDSDFELYGDWKENSEIEFERPLLYEAAIESVESRYDSQSLYGYMKQQRKVDLSWRTVVKTTPVIEFVWYCLSLIRTYLRAKRTGRNLSGARWGATKLPEATYAGSHVTALQEVTLRREARLFRKHLRKKLNEVATPFERVSPYVYLPLHYQPEATTLPLGSRFADQLRVVSVLSRALPKGWTLIVKEHPSQFSETLFGHQGRFLSFYEQIVKHPNVRLVTLDTDSLELIERSDCVATVTGTAGWEGLVRGKPCLVFGNAWYAKAKGAIQIQNAVEVALAIGRVVDGSLREEVDPAAFLEEFLKYCIYDDIRELSSGKAPQRPARVARAIRKCLDKYTPDQSLPQMS